ncbi:MAG: hypothetical protein AAGA54_31460 [Myxococcota bacterium]
MDASAPSSQRDATRALFVIALTLGAATLVLRDVYGVRLGYDALAFVWFAALAAAAVSLVASLLDAARTRRTRSLYFAVVVTALHVLGFRQDMDESLRLALAALLMLLLAVVLVVEAASLFGSGSTSNDADDGP